ncbi:hypothetical protein HYX17_01230 [Candidatus Woesearchaeota archaeon]|nr:hypothetical protein [Candidatus Woesearchaeota archaeon]
MKYHPEVKPFINSNEELDNMVFSLWHLWPNINMNLARSKFEQATGLAVGLGNIGRPESYIPHCNLVSQRCREFSEIIKENYPFLNLDPKKLEFAGLTEDSVYLVGGNGKNNSNGEDSNPFHEILTYIQLKHIGYSDLADGMALHFVAPQILKKEQQERKRFSGVSYKRSPMLDILTGVDALCTTEWLPEKHGSMEDALEFRIKDIIERRSKEHPLVVALENGGRNHLNETLKRLKYLQGHDYSEREIEEIYR